MSGEQDSAKLSAAQGPKWYTLYRAAGKVWREREWGTTFNKGPTALSQNVELAKTLKQL